jgi:transposase
MVEFPPVAYDEVHAMLRGRPKAPLTLPDQDRQALLRWSKRAKTANALAQRARIVLRCADEVPNSAVARELGITDQTVGKWRSRYVALGLAGLLDEERSGAPRQISDEQVEEILIKTLESTPKDATHWSTRSMAEASGLSDHTIARIWHAFGLQPHRVETFKLSNDPQFIEKVRDIVGLY